MLSARLRANTPARTGTAAPGIHGKRYMRRAYEGMIAIAAVVGMAHKGR